MNIAINPTDEDEVDRLKSAMLKKSYYAMFRRIVNPAALKPVVLEHYKWIIDLEKRGLVFASGPLFKADGTMGVGMTILRAQSHEEAETLAIGDPFCKAGAAEFEIQRWQINEGRISIAIDFSDQTYTFE